jgi:methylated-DNA-[protein]-cysteine S-methyltransferase
MTPPRTSSEATVTYERVASPIGVFLVAGSGRTVCATRLPGTWDQGGVPVGWRESRGAVAAAAEQLEEYFEGTRRDFDLTFEPHGTEFQRRVWRALEEIPFGATASYRDVATATGNAKATRAVGMANNRNPIALFIPCHRVIGADGTLTGYGGGLEMKSWLLAHEQAVLAGTRGPRRLRVPRLGKGAP